MSSHVLLISGSARRGSRSKALADAIAGLLQEKQLTAELISLHELTLPVFNGEPEQGEAAEVKRLREAALGAAGFIIVTPEYHNGISGALKNALDFLGDAHFRGKPVAIAAAAGGGKGGINALNNLRLVLRGVYGVVLPEQYVADPGQLDGQGRFADREGLERLGLLVDDLRTYL